MSDIEGLSELIRDISDAPLHAQLASRSVVQKSSENVKRNAQRLIAGLPHAPAYPASITYETHVRGGGTVEGLVGPDKDRPQGALGNLLEYGSANNAPLTHLGPALDIEGPDFEKAMRDLGDL